MANLQASKKDIRKIAKRTLRNRMIRSELKSLGQRLRKAAGDPEAAQLLARNYVSALDKAAKRGVIHRNKAIRQKSAVSIYIFS